MRSRHKVHPRSVSEGIKSEIYAYRAGAAPYGGDCALEELRTKVGSIVDWAKNLALEIEIGPVVQPLPPTMSAALYLDHRVGGQIARYYQSAKKSGRRAQAFHWIQILPVIFTATLGAFATLFAPQVASLGSWTAVLTTVVGGLAAYAAGSHYDLQATMALATVRELQDLVDEWRASASKRRRRNGRSSYARARR